jgi:predicted DNA-binding protein
MKEQNNQTLRLRAETIENLHIFSEILKKSPEEIIEEALDAYFDQVQKELMEKNLMDENAQTNLSYDEFWDGVDI